MSTLTPRQRVEIALRGGHSDRVPFVLYENKIPQCTAERQMRNRGLCIVKGDVPVFQMHQPQVKITQQVYWEGDRQFRRTWYETPLGRLSTLDEDAGFTAWHHEKLFKSREDYATLLFLIQDERYTPNYEVFAAAEKDFGEDAIFRAQIGLEPLQALISGSLMGTEDFCIQWLDNRDEILKLYQAIAANHRQIYRLVAQSPVSHANYGGNVTPEIIGLENFEKYYVPHYNEAAEVLHQHGKLLGCHFDANCKLLAKAIAGTGLDYIEAFTPAPGSDLTLAEARAAWPDKVLSLNFPSAVHLKPDSVVEATTIELLNQAGTPDGLIMGVTEDMPPHRWQHSCQAIMTGLERHAREHPQWYANRI